MRDVALWHDSNLSRCPAFRRCWGIADVEQPDQAKPVYGYVAQGNLTATD